MDGETQAATPSVHQARCSEATHRPAHASLHREARGGPLARPQGVLHSRAGRDACHPPSGPKAVERCTDALRVERDAQTFSRCSNVSSLSVGREDGLCDGARTVPGEDRVAAALVRPAAVAGSAAAAGSRWEAGPLKAAKLCGGVAAAASVNCGSNLCHLGAQICEVTAINARVSGVSKHAGTRCLRHAYRDVRWTVAWDGRVAAALVRRAAVGGSAGATAADRDVLAADPVGRHVRVARRAGRRG